MRLNLNRLSNKDYDNEESTNNNMMAKVEEEIKIKRKDIFDTTKLK